MDLEGLYVELRSFLNKDYKSMTGAELLESLRSIVHIVDNCSVKSYVNAMGLNDPWSLYSLKSKIRDIKRELWVNDSFITQKIKQLEVEFGSKLDSLNDYVFDEITLDSINHRRELVKGEIEDLKKKAAAHNVDYSEDIAYLNQQLGQLDIEERIVYEGQPFYLLDECDKMGQAAEEYSRLVKVVEEVNSAIREFLDEDSLSSFFNTIHEELLFADIAGVILKLFGSTLFEDDLTESQLLLALNLRGDPIELADDRSKSAVSALINVIVECYGLEQSFLKAWEQQIPNFFNVPVEYYFKHKKDIKHDDSYKWGKKLREFQQYLEGLNELKQKFVLKG